MTPGARPGMHTDTGAEVRIDPPSLLALAADSIRTMILVEPGVPVHEPDRLVACHEALARME
jgi:hypothetical protein